MTDFAALLRSGGAQSPLKGYTVQHIYTNGRSGQSTILSPYVDYHHESARERLGHVPYDGYMIRVGATPTHRPTDSVLVLVMGEAEILEDVPYPDLVPLADTDNPKFRYYEIAGVGHGLTARPDLDRSLKEVVPDGLARDSVGNALGGLRLPWMDVPDARYVGVISKKNPLQGGMVPFDNNKMKELYGSKAAWQAKIENRLKTMAQDRWIESRDIPLMLKRGVTPALAIGFDE